ncbi:MAG: hypothetical protein WB988_18375 [Candidatus Nitrosopolaris sp.]
MQISIPNIHSADPSAGDWRMDTKPPVVEIWCKKIREASLSKLFTAFQRVERWSKVAGRVGQYLMSGLRVLRSSPCTSPSLKIGNQGCDE